MDSLLFFIFLHVSERKRHTIERRKEIFYIYGDVKFKAWFPQFNSATEKLHFNWIVGNTVFVLWSW